MVFTYPIIALQAGPDMPISFLLATTICFFIGNTVAQFSRYMPSSGGYYSFATRGLGPRIGFMATWSYLVYDLIGGAGSSGFLGYLLSDTVRTGLRHQHPVVGDCVDYVCRDLDDHALWDSTFGARHVAFGWTRVADHARRSRSPF